MNLPSGIMQLTNGSRNIKDNNYEERSYKSAPLKYLKQTTERTFTEEDEIDKEYLIRKGGESQKKKREMGINYSLTHRIVKK